MDSCTFSEGDLPFVHPEVDDGIDHAVGHGQPIEGQIHVLRVRFVGHLGVVVQVEEVAVIREPTYAEDHDDHDKHFHHLSEERESVMYHRYNIAYLLFKYTDGGELIPSLMS